MPAHRIPLRRGSGGPLRAPGAPSPCLPATLYVYGEPANAAVTRVRVHGSGFTHTTKVDARTGGYAVAVPEVTSATHTERAGQVVATLDFLAADGQELDTLTVRDR